MNDAPRRTAIVPINLGPASNFDRDIFTFSSYRERNKLGKGEFLLDATLDEMLKIKSMGTDPRQWEEAAATARFRYDQLKKQQERLEERSKPGTLLQMLNVRKAWRDFRAVRLFLASAKTLYKETRSRSEQIRRTINREFLSAVPQDDIQPVGDDLPPDANIVALAIPLDDSIDEATAERSIMEAVNSLANLPAEDPFVDPLRSAAESLLTLGSTGGPGTPNDGVFDNPTSPQSPSSTSQCSSPKLSIRINFDVRDSILSSNSILQGANLNHGTERSESQS